MCLTIPKRVLSIQKDFIEVASPSGKERLGAIVKVKVGDWILSQSGVIISKISAKEARETKDLYKSMNKKEEEMEMNGLIRLLMFAYGATKAGKCGGDFFAARIRDFLIGQKSESDVRYIINDIKKNLVTAWPNLVKLGGDPLSLSTVSRYIIKEHNLFAKPECQVQTGKVIKCIHKKQTLEVSLAGETKRIRYIKPLGDHLRPGDRIVFHYDWFVGMIEDFSVPK